MTFGSNTPGQTPAPNPGIPLGWKLSQLPVAGPGFTQLDKPCIISNEVQPVAPAQPPQNPSAGAPARQQGPGHK